MKIGWRSMDPNWLRIPLVVLSLSVAACKDGSVSDSGQEPPARPGGVEVPAASATATDSAPSRWRGLAGTAGTEADWEILEAKLRWAWSEGVDTMPIGDAMVRIGLTFLGTEYGPGTLEIQGPERLVVNLRRLDCVTLVENVLGITRIVKEVPRDLLDLDPDSVAAAYARTLTSIRYRGGVIQGYPSRLHYFSEWVSDNERKGFVRSVSPDLGGVWDHTPVRFMSEHREAYPQLGDPIILKAIRELERRLDEEPRYYIPQEDVRDRSPSIRNGDVIAATSSVEGLDVAHTGIAVWVDGSLRLLHAPLIGDSVQVSEESLATRIMRIGGQDGIMVARPAEPSW
jgi:hypothetical protein